MRRTTTSRVLADLVRPTGAFSPDMVIDITEFVADEGEVLVGFVVPVLTQARIIARNFAVECRGVDVGELLGGRRRRMHGRDVAPRHGVGRWGVLAI